MIQFLRIGSHACIGGGSIIDKNVPPFSTGYGNRLEIKGVNIVGLKRRGFSRSEISAISDTHRLYFRSDFSEVKALRQIEAEVGESKEVQEFTKFFETVGWKICRKIVQRAEIFVFSATGYTYSKWLPDVGSNHGPND